MDLYRVSLGAGDEVAASVNTQSAGGGLVSLLRIFDATGRQTKTSFGTARGINAPTAPPRIIQLSARFSF